MCNPKIKSGCQKFLNDQTISLRIIIEKQGNAVSGIHSSPIYTPLSIAYTVQHQL